MNLKSDDEHTSRDRIGNDMFTDAGIQHLLIELVGIAVVVWLCKGNGLNKHLMKDIRIVFKEGVVWDEAHDGSGRYWKISRRERAGKKRGGGRKWKSFGIVC